MSGIELSTIEADALRKMLGTDSQTITLKDKMILGLLLERLENTK